MCLCVMMSSNGHHVVPSGMFPLLSAPRRCLGGKLPWSSNIAGTLWMFTFNPCQNDCFWDALKQLCTEPW